MLLLMQSHHRRAALPVYIQPIYIPPVDETDEDFFLMWFVYMARYYATDKKG